LNYFISIQNTCIIGSLSFNQFAILIIYQLFSSIVSLKYFNQILDMNKSSIVFV